jgi:hypothetical protein
VITYPRISEDLRGPPWRSRLDRPTHGEPIKWSRGSPASSDRLRTGDASRPRFPRTTTGRSIREVTWRTKQECKLGGLGAGRLDAFPARQCAFPAPITAEPLRRRLPSWVIVSRARARPRTITGIDSPRARPNKISSHFSAARRPGAGAHL